MKAIITFPAGFAKEVQSEILSIFSDLWLKKKTSPSISLHKNYIRIINMHIDSLFELLFRCPAITDIRLIVHESIVKTKEDLKRLCGTIPWEKYLAKSYPIKLKVDSTASQLFHEGAMKEIINASLRNYIFDSNEPQNDGVFNHLFFELFKNKLTVSISLAGSEIYKRNYKKNLISSAPLREDIAHMCIKQALPASPQNISVLYVPFGGSGTFIFEFLIFALKLPNHFFEKKFIFEETSLLQEKEKTVNFIKRKSNTESEKVEFNLKKIIYSDIDDKIAKIFSENYKYFIDKVGRSIDLQVSTDNFFNLDVKEFSSNLNEGDTVFMPLNPPYGLRLNSKGDSEKFYTKIINKVSELGACLKANKVTLCVLILCPSEETWSLAMNKLRVEGKETFHFTQGGVHIRGVSFTY